MCRLTLYMAVPPLQRAVLLPPYNAHQLTSVFVRTVPYLKCDCTTTCNTISLQSSTVPCASSLRIITEFPLRHGDLAQNGQKCLYKWFIANDDCRSALFSLLLLLLIIIMIIYYYVIIQFFFYYLTTYKWLYYYFFFFFFFIRDAYQIKNEKVCGAIIIMCNNINV